MGDDRGWINERNTYGAYSCDQEKDRILFFSQLFKTGELWGIDTDAIEKESQFKYTGKSFGVIPAEYIEKLFTKTLRNYLIFAQNTLKLPLPLKYIAGLTDIENYRLGFNNRYWGTVVEQHITYSEFIDDYEIDPADILRPFFNHIWDSCGEDRPDKKILS